MRDAPVSRRSILRAVAGSGVALGATAGVSAELSADDDPVDHVDPFVGTGRAAPAGSDDAMPYPNVFPGPTAPHGMVQLSPDTGFNVAGYHYEDEYIEGFSHTHLSGAGCRGLGNFLVTATTGPVRIRSGREPSDRTFGESAPRGGYRSRFSHDTETAEPGYYAVTLEDYDVRAELTASERVGVHRYTFPESSDSHLLFDVTHHLGALFYGYGSTEAMSPSSVEIRDDRTVVGTTTVPIPFCSWNGTGVTPPHAVNQDVPASGAPSRPYTIHFAARISRPFDDAGVWNGPTTLPEARETTGQEVGAHLDYGTAAGEELLVKVGISYVSQENALANIDAEVPDWDFAGVRERTRTAWNERLSRLTVEGGQPADRVTFYTALYRALGGPTLVADADGSYRGMDDEVHQADYDRYSFFSLWDTFRAQHPLLTLVEPDVQRDALRSLVGMAEEGGWLPKWAFANRYTDVMIADHATSVIADSIVKGFDGFDVEAALDAMVQNATETPPPTHDFDGRSAREQYETFGYIPHDVNSGAWGSVSTTIEDAYCDWALARAAETLDRPAIASRFDDRASYYRNVIDPDTGFARPRNADGSWVSGFDPASWEGFTEGNAWTYTWFAPHDIGWLVEELGRDTFESRLDRLLSAFVYPARGEPFTGYWHGNEPSHHIPYLYAFVGRPEKTAEVVHRIRAQLYGPTPGGLPGNEDYGQLSAWYVFSALGFYPVTPGQGTYVLGTPLFDRVELELAGDHYDGGTFTIETTGPAYDPDRPRYVVQAAVDGRTRDGPWFEHSAIADGGTLSLQTARNPGGRWSEPPPSMSD